MAAPKITAMGPILQDVAAVAATAYIPGTLVYNNSETWTPADADAVTTYAQGICMDYKPADSEAGDRISVCFEALIEDTDAPFTAGAAYYLSSTAGEYTSTRPVATSTSRLVQDVGIARSTSLLHLKTGPPKEMSDYQQFTKSSLGAAAETAFDGSNYYSAQHDADNDISALTAHVPENAISLAAVFLHYGEDAEASTITLAITVSSTLHDAQWDAVTADSTISAFDVAAAIDPDDIGKSSIATAFDATNIIRPGALLGVKVNVDLGGTDITHLYGITFVWRLV